ncbi:MAG TPA: trypsin-like peptidase domain-containing protein [Ktedonobacterales bacterium]|nr:trypsin-like peptidase domain-containing protein [Ktedonobacterales bacterium]
MRSAVPRRPDRDRAGLATLRRPLLALFAVAFIAIATTLPVAAKDRPPGGVLTNPVVRAIDVSTPAVVRIATLYTAHLTLSACGLTVTLPTSGAYTVGGLGSGAFVSAQGDVLTADHVVDIDRASLDDEMFGVRQVGVDVASFLNAACRPSAPVTADDVANGIVQFNGFPFSTKYSPPRVLVWRSESYLGAISGASSSATPTLLGGLMKAPYKEAHVLATSSFGEDDLALIHIDLTDTPSIQLNSSRQLAVEDALTVIGFPGNGDFNGDPTNLLTPSVNNVTISALKRNDNGSQLIQVGGNVEHGDSGGPALDSDGRIVGSDTQGITAFLRSSDNAMSLLSNAHIDTKPGTFQALWQQAFADYADTTPGHWHAAAREMDALSAMYPDFHGLDPYRAYAHNAAIGEASSSSFLLSQLPLPLPVIATIGAGFVLLILALILLALRRLSRSRKRKRAQAAPAPLSVWSNAGISQGYPGAGVASPYAPTAYNGPAQPAPPANGQWPYAQQPYAPYPQGERPAQPQSQSQPYSGYAPYGAAPQSSRSHPVSGPVPSSPNSYDGPQSGSWQDGGATARCVNGHPMQANAARCAVCGAERDQSGAMAPSDASGVPPWAQNR